ncbi:MAG: TonB-dependent receptor [Blastocatellia bacterium]|nr:TonB-dependent receptor [Blastocatellia bacterium]
MKILQRRREKTARERRSVGGVTGGIGVHVSRGLIWLAWAPFLAMVAYGQSATASLRGAVTDERGAVIANAAVTVTDAAKAVSRKAVTDSDGLFVVAQLPPSRYRIRVEQSGFAVAELPDLVLNVGEQATVRVQMKVAQVGEVVTISEASVVGDSPAVATVVDRQFVENQPLNGRSFQTLVELSPGVVVTPANLVTPGQFSVNGQRAGSNYFTVDGVSANFGSTASTTLYETAGGGVPAYSSQGSTASLASVDAVQEFSIQTSTYAPEFGRQPGAQVQLVTRSGTNAFHGALFNYLRNDKLDANNFFANANNLARPPIRQNDFGGVLGGPVRLPKSMFGPLAYDGRNRTFFFFSYEGVRLRTPFVTVPLQVPSLAARQSATGVLRDILNAFPLPTGPAFANAPNAAPYQAAFSKPSSLDATSVRIDQHFGAKLNVFGRINHAPSVTDERARFCAASCVARLAHTTDTYTAGATLTIGAGLSNDVRVNYSRAGVNQSYFIDSFGGAIVPPQSSLYPPFTSGPQGYIYIEVDPAGDNTISDGLFSDQRQRQFNIVENLSLAMGGHALKFGADYRRLAPSADSGTYRRNFIFPNITSLAGGVAPSASVVALDAVLQPVYHNFSAYAQDTWRATSRLTLTYGLRYEVNPAPSEQNGREPVTVATLVNPTSLAPRGTRFYETTFNNFALRFGASYQLSRRLGTVVRGGFGVFYDLGYGFTGTAFSTTLYPNARTLALTNQRFDSPAATVQPPPVSPNPPYPRIFAYQPGFKLPYTMQYNLTIEQTIGGKNVLTAAYVGAIGRRLGRVTTLINPGFFTRIDAVTNDATSDYHALQLQFQRRLSNGLQALASYTFAKSLDIVSEESFQNRQSPTGRFDPRQDRGPSSFDVRHAFNAALSYAIPTPFANGVGRAVFGGFGLDAIMRARSATPVNVLSGRDPFGLGFTTVARPDLVPGQPLYLESDSFAGGKRFNPAAFDAAAPIAQGRQGTLGRNVLRGFGASQLDLTLRRQFQLTERLNLQFRAEAFNLFNQANFANPTGIVTSGNFGRATQMLASGLGGLSPLFQIGGPRSIQLALKLQF